jgi:uncharacterized protein YjiS (DUF1127 family)
MSKESGNKAFVGRWSDTGPDFEAKTTQAPIRFHDWIDYRSLTPDQRQGVRQELIRRALAARAQALHNLGSAVLRALQAAPGGGAAIIRSLAKAVIAAASKWWRAYDLRRVRYAAVREAHALDDRTLRDIGVSRSEIEWVVIHGRDAPWFHWASQPQNSCTRSSSDDGSPAMSTGGVVGRLAQSQLKVSVRESDKGLQPNGRRKRTESKRNPTAAIRTLSAPARSAPGYGVVLDVQPVPSQWLDADEPCRQANGRRRELSRIRRRDHRKRS